MASLQRIRPSILAYSADGSLLHLLDDEHLESTALENNYTVHIRYRVRGGSGAFILSYHILIVSLSVALTHAHVDDRLSSSQMSAIRFNRSLRLQVKNPQREYSMRIGMNMHQS